MVQIQFFYLNLIKLKNGNIIFITFVHLKNNKNPMYLKINIKFRTKILILIHFIPLSKFRNYPLIYFTWYYQDISNIMRFRDHFFSSFSKGQICLISQSRGRIRMNSNIMAFSIINNKLVLFLSVQVLLRTYISNHQLHIFFPKSQFCASTSF